VNLRSLGPVCDRAVESWHSTDLFSSLGVWTQPVNSYGAEIGYQRAFPIVQLTSASFVDNEIKRQRSLSARVMK